VSEVRVAAGGLARVYEVGGGLPRPVALDTPAGRCALVAHRFSLLVDGRAVDGDGLQPAGEPAVEAGRRLAWRARDPDLGLEVAVEVTGDRGHGVVRTAVTVSGRGRLEGVEVEGWVEPGARDPVAGTDAGSDADPRRLGQPLLGDGWFAGLEHPGAENVAGPGGPTFRIPLAADLAAHPAAAPVRVPPLVVGGAEPGRELAGFWDHLDRVRARPPGLVVLANNWYQLGAVGRMDEAGVRAELEGFEAVRRAHGLSLDAYCLDDPWDGSWEPATGLWGRLDPARFPGGPGALAGGGAVPIGLWVSPWGGYFDRHDRRVAWGRAQGYEVQDGQWPCLCPAGTRYGDHLRQALVGWASAGVRYWKLDGVQFDCPDPGHGHAIAPGGRTDQMDRFAALLDAVRAARPGAVLAFTTGSNPSPWWLRHADFLWRGGLDDAAPPEFEGPAAERFDTYIDTCLDSLRGTALPLSAVVTFSLVENQARAYREPRQDERAWARHCWLMVGRGGLHHDLYVAPDSLDGREWDVVARALAWARHHQAALARSRMVGGHPQAAEPYGFVGRAAGAVVACLRNPAGHPQPFELSPSMLDGEARDLEVVWGDARVPRRVTAPVTVELAPFEVMVATGRAGLPSQEDATRGS
jgi:hypothetical protein